MTKQAQFSVEAKKDFIHLKTWGELDVETLHQPAEAALALGQQKGLRKLLDNIQEIDTSGVSISVQSKAMGILWKLKAFDKVAIVFKDKEVGLLFLKSLSAIHLSGKFNGFDNEADAIAWLRKD